MGRFMPARMTKVEELQVARDVAREQRREEVDVVVAD